MTESMTQWQAMIPTAYELHGLVTDTVWLHVLEDRDSLFQIYEIEEFLQVHAC